jgi:hypothetical protein
VIPVNDLRHEVPWASVDGDVVYVASLNPVTSIVDGEVVDAVNARRELERTQRPQGIAVLREKWCGDLDITRRPGYIVTPLTRSYHPNRSVRWRRRSAPGSPRSRPVTGRSVSDPKPLRSCWSLSQRSRVTRGPTNVRADHDAGSEAGCSDFDRCQLPISYYLTLDLPVLPATRGSSNAPNSAGRTPPANIPDQPNQPPPYLTTPLRQRTGRERRLSVDHSAGLPGTRLGPRSWSPSVEHAR